MPKACFLIAANLDAGFLSQVAVISRALRAAPRTRWETRILLCAGGDADPALIERWRPHLPDVDLVLVSPERFAQEGMWAQSDDVFRLAPRDADVLVALDADTLPVAGLEPLLDEVLATGEVAGVIAHFQVPGARDAPNREAWRRLADGLVDAPLEFGHACTLMDESAPLEARELPFYLNFGVVLFPRAAFDAWVPAYLALRRQLMARMSHPDYSGQVALTLALARTGARTRALPMRYNFPNDPRAERLYPDELANVVVFHYLRTGRFDRQRIFTDEHPYRDFLALELTGSDLAFQQAVRRLLGEAYPFA
jgi:hypothetical protein